MKYKKKIITVAIDSPAAAGAGTQARLIAKEYNLFQLDTGRIYRLVGKMRLDNPKSFNYKNIKKKIKKLKIKDLQNKKLLNDNVATSASIIAKNYLIPKIEKNVNFKKDYDPSIPDVNTNKEQLIQALINLVRNSIQALEFKGNITIRTRTEPSYTIGNEYYSLVTKIDVIDNGPGISQDNQDKIFEPFFTTESQGNGLGLYLCRELCLANQIAISYRREPSGDSCFRLQFAHPQRSAFPD